MKSDYDLYSSCMPTYEYKRFDIQFKEKIASSGYNFRYFFNLSYFEFKYFFRYLNYLINFIDLRINIRITIENIEFYIRLLEFV
jgi:hypothetical protein